MGIPKTPSITSADLPWLVGTILASGVAGPILLMVGLSSTPASSASLLLSLEGVLTATLAWCVFKEHFDHRIILGMVAITTGSFLLSWEGQPEVGLPWGILAIVGACLARAIDNNVTRKISAGDPVQIAGIKGFVAGIVNLTIAFGAGASPPSVRTVLTTAVVGFLGYGVSLVLFILGLRYLGTARTGAYFSLAPFAGAVISILVLGDHLTIQLLVAAALILLC